MLVRPVVFVVRLYEIFRFLFPIFYFIFKIHFLQYFLCVWTRRFSDGDIYYCEQILLPL